jgi:hypothetical protein
VERVVLEILFNAFVAPIDKERSASVLHSRAFSKGSQELARPSLERIASSGRPGAAPTLDPYRSLLCAWALL